MSILHEKFGVKKNYSQVRIMQKNTRSETSIRSKDEREKTTGQDFTMVLTRKRL